MKKIIIVTIIILSVLAVAIGAQIRETLKQFSTVKSVIISIDGRTEDILQP